MSDTHAILAEYGAGNVHAFPSYVEPGKVVVFANSDGPEAESRLTFAATPADVRAFALDMLRVADETERAAAARENA